MNSNEPEEQKNVDKNITSKSNFDGKNDSNKYNNDFLEENTNEIERKLTNNHDEILPNDDNDNKKENSCSKTDKHDEFVHKSMKRALPDSSVLTGTIAFETPFSSIAKKVSTHSFFDDIEKNKIGKFDDSFGNKSDESKENQFTMVAVSVFGEDDVQLYESKSAKISVFKTGEINEWDQNTMTHVNIIKNKTSGDHRLVCFQIGTGRIQLNTEINDNMKLQKIRDKIIIFMGRDIQNQSVLVPYKLSFPDKCMRDSFHDKLLSYLKVD